MMDEHSIACLDFARVRELLAGYAMTGLGRALAARIDPATRLPVVERWYRQFAELERLVEQRGLPPFAGLTDVRETVRRCAPPLKVGVDEIARVGDALAATHVLTSYLADLPEDAAELQHLAQRVGDFGTVALRIRTVIDERAQVRDEASPKLAAIRRQIDGATRETRAAVDRILHDAETRRMLQYPNYTFFNDRLVLPVRAEYRGRLPGIIHRSSDSGATIFVEPAQAVEMNNRISNLRAEEQEEINHLLWDLAHEVYINADAIVETLDALAVLDLTVAKLRFAADFELRCPELLDEPKLSLRRARHPLLIDLFRREAKRVEDERRVVPIDCRLGDDFDLLIITGPNTGGKTVTLKTVGLLILMVQSGLPIPVDEGSRCGVFKRVLIDIGDEQSMQQSLSTFSAHLRWHMDMLNKAGPGVLVLIDELGAGTDPDEGAAIGQAILDELLRSECRCIATTHLGALKAFPLTRERAENGSVEFDTETLQPTYHLNIGTPGTSNAIAIAKRLGMPRRLIEAARQNVSEQAKALAAALSGTVDAKREAEQARSQAESARIDAERARGEAEADRARLKKQQSAFHDWVQRVVHLQPGDAVRVRGFDRDGSIVRLRIDQHRAEVDVGAFSVEVPLGDILPPETPAPPPRAPKPPPAAPAVKPRQKPRKQPQTKATESGRQRRRSQDGQVQPAKPRYQPLTDQELSELREGDSVLVKRFHRQGRLIRLEPDKKLAVVSVGQLEVEIPFNGLALPGAKPQA